jgi:hypothetical protein
LNKYSYTHFRITDLSKAKKINYTKSVLRKIDYTGLIQPSLYLILSLFIILISLFIKPFSIRYQDNYFEGKYYSMKGEKNDNLILKCDNEKKIISVNEYNNRNDITKINIVPENYNNILIVIYVFLFIINSLLLIDCIEKIKIDKKVHSFFVCKKMKA